MVKPVKIKYPERRTESTERDEKSIKCPDCGGHIMLQNSVSYVNAVDSQYRPIYGEKEEITVRGVCISNPSHHHKFEGFIIIRSSTPPPTREKEKCL